MQSMTFNRYFKGEKLTSLKDNSAQATEEQPVMHCKFVF